MRKWTTVDSEELYNIRSWGDGYVRVNSKGNVSITPYRTAESGADITQILDELSNSDTALPVLLRFPQIIGDRIEQLHTCFTNAAKEYDYNGQYSSVFPVKVNQQRHVVEEVARHAETFQVGLEAGSKPELQVVLAAMQDSERLIICNGYKDEEFIELALMAQKMGKNVHLVVEKINELHLIMTIAERVRVRPNIGIRIKLTSAGSGKWEESGGDVSKFGLTASELLEAIELTKSKGYADCVRLIHFHLGSQITNIRHIKNGLKEIAQYYRQLRNLECPIDYVDVGGGLGVDYDGSRSIAANSINYTYQEYANDIVYALAEICTKHGLPHPNLISESGRALTAHHSVLVFNVLAASGLPRWRESDSVAEDDHQVVQDLHEILNNINPRNFRELWHDALDTREEYLKMFVLDLIDLEDRARAERLFWSIATVALEFGQSMKRTPPELSKLPKMLAEKYYCNFSLFQSLPDAWAIDQIFPICPIHRLKEEPTIKATLHDITCDSDGMIDQFVSGLEYQDYMQLHAYNEKKPYYLGVFLVGAYQEILGDLHNLFGDTNVAVVQVDKQGEFDIVDTVEGETVADVLKYVQFDPKSLVRTVEKWVNKSVKEGKITAHKGKQFLAMYRSGLYDYTYLEE